MPRVSILLPCRDAAATLPEAMASIAAQTFTDFDVIAVNDGALDDTAALLDEWAARDGRVRVLHEGRRGLVPALEAARAAATGPLLARMDADDVAHPDRLARQVALLDAEPGLAACGTNLSYTISSLHFTAFPVGILLIGLSGHLVIRRVGRWHSLWIGAFGISLSALILVAGQSALVTIGAAFSMGLICSLILVIVPSLLSELHKGQRAAAPARFILGLLGGDRAGRVGGILHDLVERRLSGNQSGRAQSGGGSSGQSFSGRHDYRAAGGQPPRSPPRGPTNRSSVRSCSRPSSRSTSTGAWPANEYSPGKISLQ